MNNFFSKRNLITSGLTVFAMFFASASFQTLKFSVFQSISLFAIANLCLLGALSAHETLE